MVNVWPWICELSDSAEFLNTDSPLELELASTLPSKLNNSTRSIQLRAERSTHESNSDQLVTFSLCLRGFHKSKTSLTIWVSDTCPLSSDKPFLPLLLQLLREIITRSPATYETTCPRSHLQNLKSDPVSWILESHSTESFSSFFDFIILTRLFWLCACDAPTEVGSFYFRYLLGPKLESLVCNHAPVLRTFFVSVGIDVELCFMRTLGYITVKWLMSTDIGVGLQALKPPPNRPLGFSYGTEAHGLWILKGYTPVLSMKKTNYHGQNGKFLIAVPPKETVLKYALAHQQLEAVIQLEYTVEFKDSYIQVKTRVNNIRLNIAGLGYSKNDDDVDLDYGEEKYFPSRIRVWVGPEIGATYVGGVTLGRSTNNEEREIEMQRTMKGSFGKLKVPKVKARTRMSAKTKSKNWRIDQDAEGNAAVFDAVLCDPVTGDEVTTIKPFNEGEYCNRFMNRSSGVNRVFTKNGGVVFGGDEYGEEMTWRVSREMEGSVLKWRIGGRVWLSYWPNKVKSLWYETRSVDWCDEVDLPLIQAN